MSLTIHYSLFIILLLLGAAGAAPVRKDTFAEALAEAKKSRCALAVFIHGSSWHPASKIFGQKIWQDQGFSQSLKQPLVLTQIEVKQHLDKEAAKAQAKTHKGWNGKTVRSYPAIQIYGSDGHLLKNYQGRELRILTSPAALAKHINHISTLSNKRDKLIADLAVARSEKKAKEELRLLVELVDLGLRNEPKIIEQLKKADPNDSTGCQARLSFRNWEFVRHITGLIKGDKTADALLEIDKMLASSHHTPEQRCLILGAKGKALATEGKLPAAWTTFQQAHQADPKGANGKAMLRYGIRVAGLPLRETVPINSKLYGKNIGKNISRDNATFTMSSAASDDPSQHASLFKGPLSKKGFAFHTDKEKDAHIVIDLHAAYQVKALQIANRNSSQQRAETLTLWTSTDQKTWTQAWTAKEASASWGVLLEKPITARYLKLGLKRDTPEHLHLRAVDVFGVRP
ncbi:MAG: discoidin domain-containing protein [Akkermansiaceae bacterium]